MAFKDSTDEKFQEQISGDKLSLIQFSASWCGPCQQLKPIIEKISKNGLPHSLKYSTQAGGKMNHILLKKIIDIYKKNNRTDLLEVEQNELEILTVFLPKQLGEEETKKICAEVISKLGASSVKDMGKVMGILKKDYADKIDFAKAGPLIKELLSS